MKTIEIISTFFFVALLVMAVVLLISVYICDNFSCKAFNDAANKAPKGTQQYAITLMNELYNDGIWPVPYIGAAILTPLSLWFLDVPITVRNFAILFFVSFIVIYLIFVFFGHHYIKFISAYVTEYIRESCGNEPTEENIEPVGNNVEEEEADQ